MDRLCPEPRAGRRRQAGVLRLLLGLAVSIVLGACDLARTEPAFDLRDRTFVSASVSENGAERRLVPGTQIRLEFGRDGRLGASAGCNHLGGTWRLDGGRLVIAGGAMTEMGCDPERHAQDEWLAAVLDSDPGVAIAEDDLILSAGNVEIRLRDREVAEPDLPLVGPLWTLTGLREGDSVSSVPGDVRATLQFADDRTVAVFTGCNQGTGTVRDAGDGTIQISQLALTKRACAGAGGATEPAILDVLGQDALRWSIDGTALTLDGPTGGLSFTSR